MMDFENFWDGIDLDKNICMVEVPNQTWHYFCDREIGHMMPHEHRLSDRILEWYENDESTRVRKI
jgi:hypothetical protein